MRDTGVLINVEWAIIDSSEGEALIDVPDDQCQLVRGTDDGQPRLTVDLQTWHQCKRERMHRLRCMHQHLSP